MASRYQSSVQVQAVSPSTGKSQNMQSLAERLRSFADRKASQLDRQAAFEGEQAGLAAATGQIGGSDLSDNSTIRSRAFNRGAMTAHAAAIQIDIRENISRIKLENQFDSEGFNASVTGYREGLVEKMDAAMRPQAVAEINDYASRAHVEIQGNIYQQETDARMAVRGKAADGMEEDMMIAARAGDLEQLTIKQEQLAAINQEGVELGDISASAVEARRSVLEEKIDGQLALGSLERTLEEGGLEEAEAALERFKKSKTPELQPGTKDAVVGKMETLLSRERAEISREASKQSAIVAAKEKILKGQVTNITAALDRGIIPGNIEEIYDLAIGTQYEAQLKKDIKFASVLAEFAPARPDQQLDFIAKYKAKKNPTTDDLNRIKRLEAIHTYTVAKSKEDALTLGVEQGILSELPEFDITNPESLEQLTMAAEIVSAHYGVDASPITKPQATNIVRTMNEGDVEQKALILGYLVNGFGSKTPEVLARIFEVGPKTYAVAGGLMLEDAIYDMPERRDIAENMLIGMTHMELNKEIIPDEFNSEFNTALGAIYAERPKHHAAVREAARALYAHEMAMSGKFNNKDEIGMDLDGLITQITGGIVELEWQGSSITRKWNGFGFDVDYQIEVPVPGMDDDDVVEWMKSITAGDISAMGGVREIGSSGAAEMINESHLRLIGVGSGHYYLETFTGNQLVNEKGEPFELVFGVRGEVDE